MLHRFLSLSLAALTVGSLLGCNRQTDVQPGCYSGRIVGKTCVNGVLIDVTPEYQIGAKAVATGLNKGTILGHNVIAVSNSQELLNLIDTTPNQTTRVAPRLYFTVTSAATHGGLQCFANDGVEGDVPSFELHNVSTSACESLPQ